MQRWGSTPKNQPFVGYLVKYDERVCASDSQGVVHVLTAWLLALCDLNE